MFQFKRNTLIAHSANQGAVWRAALLHKDVEAHDPLATDRNPQVGSLCWVQSAPAKMSSGDYTLKFTCQVATDAGLFGTGSLHGRGLLASWADRKAILTLEVIS